MAQWQRAHNGPLAWVWLLARTTTAYCNAGQLQGSNTARSLHGRVRSSVHAQLNTNGFVWLVFGFGFLKQGLWAALAVQELSVDQSSLQLRSACLCLPSTGINVVWFHHQLKFIFLITNTRSYFIGNNIKTYLPKIWTTYMKKHIYLPACPPQGSLNLKAKTKQKVKAQYNYKFIWRKCSLT